MLKNEELTIREIRPEEFEILEDLLYESIYQSNDKRLIPREVINTPKVQAYIKDFVHKKDDYCFVAEIKEKIIGAVWVRILSGKVKGYGNVNNKTPEFAIALYREYRNQGVGTMLMKRMISHLTEKGYAQTSLSVQKENYAVRLYQDLGFRVIDENAEDYIMLLKL